MPMTYRIGADENGLGAQLGPLIVTAVAAKVSDAGERWFQRKLPKRMRKDLDDSKRLVSHHDTRLGEAWARVLVSPSVKTPAELLERLSLDPTSALQEPCPKHAAHQCWAHLQEEFSASDEDLNRLQKHLRTLRDRGLEIVDVKSRVVCTKRLNLAREAGHNRFVTDLHSMEQLLLSLRRGLGEDVHAVCGKVGGIGDYAKFFGPLGGYLHVELERGRTKSSYRFPGLGEIHFVRDADASDPLVMLASLVGKYLRELLMGRIAHYYEPKSEPGERPSGYHDPITSRFIERTALLRSRRKIPTQCFVRDRDVVEPL